jgi:hypothetical protein
MNNDNGAITLTFGDCAENHVGMQIIGTMDDKGYSKKDMDEIIKSFPDNEVEIIKLHKMDIDYNHNDNDNIPEAYLYIIRNMFPEHQKLYDELKVLEWDTKALMRGKVVNKIARYNLNFANFSQEPNYEEGKGRIVNIEDIKLLKKLNKTVKKSTKNDLVIEGNYYYNVDKCGIGYHGDSERRKTIGVRLGKSFPICFQWYYKSEKVSDVKKIMLNGGDMYIMSEKTTGTDWKKRNILTLRHSAGCEKYTA